MKATNSPLRHRNYEYASCSIQGVRNEECKFVQARAMSTATEFVLDPFESSKLAGLRYVTDSVPGITRRRRGKSFQYFDPEGKPVRDKEVLARIKSLVIPPAWTNVWICTRANGHL